MKILVASQSYYIEFHPDEEVLFCGLINDTIAVLKWLRRETRSGYSVGRQTAGIPHPIQRDRLDCSSITLCHEVKSQNQTILPGLSQVMWLTPWDKHQKWPNGIVEPVSRQRS